jgi:hypothetical protein
MITCYAKEEGFMPLAFIYGTLLMGKTAFFRHLKIADLVKEKLFKFEHMRNGFSLLEKRNINLL